MNLNSEPVEPLKDIHKVLIEGVKEIIGLEDTRELFLQYRQKGEGFPSLAALQRALNERYGPRGGQGVALRVGQAAFQHALRRWGQSTGLGSNTYRMLPFRRRVGAGLVLLASLFGEAGDAEVSVSESDEHWFWQVERCPLCAGETSRGPAWSLLVALLQAFMAWAGNSKFYRVSEIECAGAGAAACRFQIDKRALD